MMVKRFCSNACSVLGRKKADVTKGLLAAVFVVLVIIPLVSMFFHVDGEALRSVSKTAAFPTAIRNSLVTAGIATVISVVLAYVLAICISRTDIRLRAVFSVIFVLPMLIPSLSHGMGLVISFGNHGIISKLLGVRLNIYGPQGIVLGSVLYALPVAFLMFQDVLKYEDGSSYETAEVLGIPPMRRFLGITLPYLRKPLISIFFSTFTLIVTDYGVPLMVGGKFTTLPVLMYQEVIGQLEFGKGAVYGSVLLIPAVVAFVMDRLTQDRRQQSSTHRPVRSTKSLFGRILAYGVCIATVIYVLIPVVSFALIGFTKDFPNNLSLTLTHFTQSIRLRAGIYLGHSVTIALCAALIGVAVAFMTAYMTARMKSGMSGILHLCVIASATVPGIVLGLSYVLAFKASALYGTMAILIMVNVAHFISSPYLMMYNSLSKINGNLESVAHTLRISRFYLIRDVLLPQCAGTILEMFSYFFVNCMMTISAVSFLATTANKPVSLLINQFEAQMQLECAAVVSLMILGVNILMKVVARLLSKKHR